MKNYKNYTQAVTSSSAAYYSGTAATATATATRPKTRLHLLVAFLLIFLTSCGLLLALPKVEASATETAEWGLLYDSGNDFWNEQCGKIDLEIPLPGGGFKILIKVDFCFYSLPAENNSANWGVFAFGFEKDDYFFGPEVDFAENYAYEEKEADVNGQKKLYVKTFSNVSDEYFFMSETVLRVYALMNKVHDDSKPSNPIVVSLITPPSLENTGYITTIDNYFSGGGQGGLKLTTIFKFWSELAPAVKNTYENITSSVFDLRIIQREQNLAGKYFFQAYNKDISGEESEGSNIISVTFLRLDTPDISLTPSGLTWAEVSFADEYVVTFRPLEGQTATPIGAVTENTYIDLADFLTPDIYFGVWELKVVARSTNPDFLHSSEVSTAVKIVKLGTPSLSKTGATTLKWTAVTGASFYKVYYDNNNYFTTSATTIDVALIGLASGKYTFTVAAAANGVQVPAPDGEVKLAAPMSSLGETAITTGATYWLVQATCMVAFVNADIETVVYEYGEVAEVPNPAKKGHEFVGWYSNKEMTKKYTSNFFTGDTVLYAKFRPLTFGEKIGNFFSAAKWYLIGGGTLAALVGFGIWKKKRG